MGVPYDLWTRRAWSRGLLMGRMIRYGADLPKAAMSLRHFFQTASWLGWPDVGGSKCAFPRRWYTAIACFGPRASNTSCKPGPGQMSQTSNWWPGDGVQAQQSEFHAKDDVAACTSDRLRCRIK